MTWEELIEALKAIVPPEDMNKPALLQVSNGDELSTIYGEVIVAGNPTSGIVIRSYTVV